MQEGLRAALERGDLPLGRGALDQAVGQGQGGHDRAEAGGAAAETAEQEDRGSTSSAASATSGAERERRQTSGSAPTGRTPSPHIASSGSTGAGVGDLVDPGHASPLGERDPARRPTAKRRASRPGWSPSKAASDEGVLRCRTDRRRGSRRRRDRRPRASPDPRERGSRGADHGPRPRRRWKWDVIPRRSWYQAAGFSDTLQARRWRNARFLVTVTGPDRTGVTATLTGILVAARRTLPTSSRSWSRGSSPSVC